MTGRDVLRPPAATGQATPAPRSGPRLTAPLLLGSLLNPLNPTMTSTALVAIGHHLGRDRALRGRT